MPRPTPPVITDRLELRQWRAADRESYAAINADPAVMEHFPSTMSRAASDAMLDRMHERIETDGYGLYAVQVGETGELIGFTGLSAPRFEAAFTPCVEVGWRLARSAWRHGYATEAAQAALSVGFDQVGLAQIVSFTTAANLRSQAVMQRIGMHHNDSDDFDHPSLEPGSPLLRHVLYRLDQDSWRRARAAHDSTGSPRRSRRLS